MNLLTEFGVEVKTKRNSKNLTQEQLAELCDLSTRAISNIENGKAEPKLITILRICVICDIELEKIIHKYMNKEEMLRNEIS